MYRLFRTSRNINNVIQKRTIYHMAIGNHTENIIERKDYSIDKCKNTLEDEVISVLGYGPQGKSQALNLKDNGFNVQLGLRKGNSWNEAIKDGWVENKNLFTIEEAAKRGTIIKYLLSDVGQIENWPSIKKNLTTSLIQFI